MIDAAFKLYLVNGIPFHRALILCAQYRVEQLEAIVRRK